MNKVVDFMNQYSTNNKQANVKDLLKAILIVKGGATNIAKKVI